MFQLDHLAIPIIVSPMAGGPTTPSLVKAVTDAGGFGLLAAGYLTADQIRDEIVDVRGDCDRKVGVNLMMPGDPSTLTPARSRAAAEYRETLLPWAERFGIELPEIDTTDQPDWDARHQVLIDARVAVATFIFGCPDEQQIGRLHEADIAVGVTVTHVEDAIEAGRRGADFLIVQGPEAGGHQGTWSVEVPVNTTPLPILLKQIAGEVGLPLVAAGGITTGSDIREMLELGASAVQMGTAFLRTPECGTTAVYKEALVSGRFEETLQSRAFSGRMARALANEFVSAQAPIAPAAYPEINALTRPIRNASTAANDPECMSMYAGVGFASAESMPAAELVVQLWNQAQSTTST